MVSYFLAHALETTLEVHRLFLLIYSNNLSNQNKGLNDCVARLVEVSKSEVAKLLFPDPLEMVFE